MHFIKKGIPLKKQLLYWFENTLTRGTRAVILWLAVSTIITAFISALILTFFNLSPAPGATNINFIDAFWQSLLHSIDTGAIQNDTGWSFRIIALIITFIGVFIFSALISILTSGLERSFEKIRKGKSEILDTDFTLILGWAPSIFKIIHELVVAHANHKNRQLVILADIDKITMEDDLNLKIRQKEILRNAYLDSRNYNKQLRIHCRSGNPLDIDNLKLVHPENAKSIIIIPPRSTENVLYEDAFVLKTTLALENQPDSKKLKPHIISILNEIKVRDALRHWETGRKSHLKKNNIFIPENEWLSKITAHTCGQPGYSSVLTEILNFEESEIYIIPAVKEDKRISIKDDDELKKFIGSGFDELVLSCVNIVPIGLEKKTDRGTELILNPVAKYPPGDQRRLIQANDRIIAMLWDIDDSISLTGITNDNNSGSVDIIPAGKHEKKILILGWNEKITCICSALCSYIGEGSEITIIAHNTSHQNFEDNCNKLKARISGRHPGIGIVCIEGDTTKYGDIDHINLDIYSSILVLGYDNFDIQQRDAKTIMTLLNLQAILKNKDINIVAELYDDKNRMIVEISQTCDYIISDNIISSLMAQLSQESLLYPVFKELFDSKGSEIYLRTVDNYFLISGDQKQISFQELRKYTLLNNEILLGYRKDREKHDHSRNYGIYFITDSAHQNITEVILSKEDRLIVLSENK